MRWMHYAVMVVLLAVGLPCRAQTLDPNEQRQPVAELSGQWRFHPGDDPRWADPAFDDSTWALLKTSSQWPSQGYPGVTIGWYRVHLIVADNTPRAVFIPGFRASYELFADGVKMGGAGEVGPHVTAASMTSRLLPLPTPRSGHREIVMAFRVALSTSAAQNTSVALIPPLLVGNAAQIAHAAHAARAETSWQEADTVVLNMAWVLAALAGFALFALRPREREYLWFGLMSLALAIFLGWQLFVSNHTVQRSTGNALNTIFGGLYTLMTIGFFARLLGARRAGFFRVVVIAIEIAILVGVANLFWPLPAVWMNALTAVVLVPTLIWLIAVLSRAAFQGVADARLMLIPVLTMWGFFILSLVLDIVQQMHGQAVVSILDIPITLWPFEISGSDLSILFFLLGTLAILLNRFTRSRREEERYAGEMEAARVVQHVLLPEQNVGLRGFRVEVEYLSAQEVGGDFYQVLPANDGGLLVVAGDVSGKGLSAAMLVAMLVGAIRSEAAYAAEPAVLLAALNDRVYGRMSGGFATCCVLHLREDGEAVVANAANPAPYLNGEEMETAGALPLGMVSGAVYEAKRVSLLPGDVLTFVSDGVVEATDAGTAELYGFERTRLASQLPAKEQVALARKFGQTDDITVLTVTRVADEI